MFDNTKPNVIIISDKTEVLSMIKTAGPYKVASELRIAGFEVAVIHHLSCFSIDEIKHVLKNLISDHTIFVGINNFFYADLGKKIFQEDIGSIQLGECTPGSFLPHGKEFNKEIKQLIKTTNPNCKIVLGGPGASDQSHFNDFDYLVVGYADNSIINLARHLLDSTTKLEKSYKSVYGPIIINDSKAEDYDFVNSKMNYQDSDGIISGETLVIELARGCIFKCTFCSYPLNGKKKLDFIRSKERIRDELINNYQQFGVTRYIFSDDTVNDSPEKCKMIYEISKSLPFKLEWWGYIRLDLMRAHPETIEWLFESGLRAAFFGIETLNPKTASAIGKVGNRQQLFSVIEKIKEKYGNSVNLHASFIFGLPYEDMDSMKTTADFLLSNANPLDSWSTQALNIRPSGKVYSNEFLSDIDKNYSKYGYQDAGELIINSMTGSIARHPNGFMDWRNQHTDYQSVVALSLAVNQERLLKKQLIVPGNGAFMLAGLGVPLDYFLNKEISSLNWHAVDVIKYKRSQQYKKKIFKECKIPDMPADTNQQCNTFTQWIKLN